MKDRFTVTLNFGNVPEPIVIPFEAIKTFADPSVEFGLRFDAHEEGAADDDDGEDGEPPPPTPIKPPARARSSASTSSASIEAAARRRCG